MLDTRRARRRSASVTLGAAAIFAATLSGCSAGGEEYSHGAVCADPQTERRVEDERCEDGRSGRHGWYFLPVGTRARPVGARLNGGSFTPPPGAAVFRGGVPREGAVITRGGFGGKSGTVGG